MSDKVKLERFGQALARSELDAVVAVSPENTWYLSGAVIDTQRTLLERLAVVVWAKGSKGPVYIVCTNEEIQARRDSWIKDIRGYVEYRESPMEVVAEALGGMGLVRGKVGIETHYLNAHYHAELTRLLPNAKLVEAGHLFDEVRVIKTPDEIRRMEQAALATDKAIRKAFEAVRPGLTERQVGVVLSSELILNGADAQAFQVLAAGENTITTHHRGGDYVIKSGDLMRTDFGGLFPGGYFSDLARTIAVGKSLQRQVDTYHLVWDEQERLIDMLRPGITCREIFASHKERWQALGWPMVRPHIGHSLGIGLHEYPLVRPGDTTPLQPGMCICLEPTHMIPDTEKYHIEDLVLVTEGAPRVLSRSADWSRLLTSGG